MRTWFKGLPVSNLRLRIRSLPGFSIILLALALTCTQLTAAPITLNLKDADINALVASVAEITGKNFVVDPRVQGTVSVISSRPMDEREIYEVFLSILTVHGFAAIPDRNIIKIVPIDGAKQESIPTMDTQLPAGGSDQMVTRVIQVNNVAASQVVPILRPLIPPQGHLAAYGPTNVLIVSDKAANVDRIANIIRRVDLASNEQVEIVPLRHATASEVVRTLSTLEQNSAASDAAAAIPGGSQLVADERTNSVLMSGDTLSRLRLRTLIAHLDTPPQGGGNTQVFYLRYAKAPDLVPVLQGVSQQIAEDGAEGAQVVAARSRGLVDIQADAATNALVVTAPPDILQSLRQVISQLDVRRAQVMVEAVIAEISKAKTAELGVQWVVDGSRDGSAVGFTNFNIGNSLGSFLRSIIEVGEGNASNVAVPEGLNLGLGSFNGSFRFAAIISALAADTDTNILSTPTLVTLDNEEAEIIVGQNRAFLTGSFTTSADGASNPFQTVERRDVGLTLKIKPQINEGNAVQLEISQEVETVIEVTSTGPETNKRSIKTNVLVEDGQILVLGGLIDDTLAESVQKVPGLGDIPILGNLFRYRKTQKEKRNLMIFLHPIILRDSVTGTLATNNKYSFIRDQQIAARQRGVALLPNESTPLLTPQYEVKRQRSMVDLRPYSPEDPAQVSQYPESTPTPPPTPTPTPSTGYPRSGYTPQATPRPQQYTPPAPQTQAPATTAPTSVTLDRGFGNK